MKTIVGALHKHLICVFGMPEALLSDLESSFVSKVTENLFSIMGVKKLNTSGYQPQANGTVERWHRFLNTALTIFANEHKTNWRAFVDSILFAYRTSMCTATGFSPFQLLFGRKATLPPDLLYSLNGKQLREEFKRGISVSESMRAAYRHARSRQIRVANANKQRKDEKQQDISFKPGDPVMIWEPTLNNTAPRKLRNIMSGPHVVVRPTSNPLLYKVKRTDKDEACTVNVNKLVHAKVDNLDLGLPLGTEEEYDQDDKDEEPHVPLGDWSSSDSDSSDDDSWVLPTIGDFVAINSKKCLADAGGWDDFDVEPQSDVEGDNPTMKEVGNHPFSVGEVQRINGIDMTVQWYGSYNKGVQGLWKKAFIDKSDDKILFADSSKYTPYTNEISGHGVSFRSIIGTPFRMVNQKIPQETETQILDAIKADRQESG
jgi:hypothetical protein